MFIKKIAINNFRLFPSENNFEIDGINIPDGQNEGGGLTLFVGENGCGKTSLLDAFALPLLSYKAKSFALHDFFNPEKKVNIQVTAEKNFIFDGTMPSVKYKGKGFLFEAGIRSRGNKSYLSSVVVSDQKYLKADGEEKPKDNTPDLRVGVNNPWKGTRFNENAILFLGKNRTYQIRSGTYNSTRFDRLMEDFDYQYIKRDGEILDLNEKLKEIRDGIDNDFLQHAINKFKRISKEEINLGMIDNWRPYNKAFFGIQKDNKQYISLDMLGSGYETIFSLLYSFYLSQQSGKQLIIFIDEPELHLHPKLQEDFVKILLEFSKNAQIILTTHSPLFVKQISCNENAKINILKKDEDGVKTVLMDRNVLPYVSANEINYLAFALPTEEYHNELYEELKYHNGDNQGIKQFDIDYFQREKQEPANYSWKGNDNEVSIHTFLRNQIHHQKDNGKADINKLKESIRKMRDFLI